MRNGSSGRTSLEDDNSHDSVRTGRTDIAKCFARCNGVKPRSGLDHLTLELIYQNALPKLTQAE